MPELADLKNVVEDILSSYETRIESISSIFDTTHLIIDGLQQSLLKTRQEREKINTQLREILAKNEHLRRKDFDNMMQEILSAQERRERQVRNLLKGYFDEQKATAQALRKGLGEFKDVLARGEARRAKESQSTIKEILAEQARRKNEVVSKLKEFQREQKDLAKRLKELLAKGKELRIKDLKAMLMEFSLQRERRLTLQRRRKEEVARVLADFKKERQKSFTKGN